jgi:general secretion pathway protein D
MFESKMKTWMAAAALAGAVTAIGCAGARAFRQGRDDEQLDQWDRAVVHYTQAQRQDPSNLRYQMALQNARRKASEQHFEKGKVYLASGQPELAVVELEQTVLLDPENDYAALELKRAREAVAKLQAERQQPSRIQKLEEETRNARAVGPILKPTSTRPISLNFPQPRPIKQIYQALGQAAGINVIFDPALKDDNVTIVLSNVTFQNALETLLRQENDFYKVIDDHTILIAADTPQNRKTYEDLVIRTFYLSNGDVTETANAIRALLGTVHISINKQENAITIRDTADKVAIAQRVIEQNDKEKSEVVVDVELLQLNLNKMLDIGLFLKNGNTLSGTYLNPTTSPTPDSGGSSTTTTTTTPQIITYDQLKNLAISQFGFTVPNFTVNFIKSNSDAELLAKPQLRITEGEKAQLVIGDRVPIPTTTFNTQNAIGSTAAIVPITSFQYQDIGIKIEMEPRVHHNKEITLKLTVEVSNLGAPVTFQGQTQPTISTRTISSTIRLKDGETNFLAGLIRRDKSASKEGPAFLSDIPVLGELFSHRTHTQQNTDLVMTITPHIIRLPDINEEDLLPVYVGTESNISYQGAPRVESFNTGGGPFARQRRQPAIPPAAQRPAAPTPPGGVQLAPSGGPSSLFTPPPKATAIPPGTPPPKNPNPNRLDAPPPAATNDAPSPASAASDIPTVQLEFDPLVSVLAPEEERTVIVRSVGGQSVAPASFTIRFDSSVVTVVDAQPLSGDPVPTLAPGSVTLHWTGGIDGPSGRPIAQLTLRGVAPGATDLTFDKAPVTDLSGSTAHASYAEALVQVK